MTSRSIVLSCLASCFALALLTAPALGEPQAADYGQGLTLEQATPIADILAAPESFVGREVRVEGEVHGVCAKAGCWMEIADPEGREIRIKVDDGVIVFPQTAVGASAVAQGTVTLHEMSREQYVGWQRHLAEETGTDFDESEVGEGPFRLVQIAGSGARIGG